MHCIAGVVITFVLLLNWFGIYLYLVIANKILTIHDKIIMLIGTWSDHPRKQCYHKGGMGRPWLTN
jgi:hypothetical protein